MINDHAQLFIDQGYSVVDVIRENKRTICFRLQRDGRDYFGKRNFGGSDLNRQELWWSDFIEQRDTPEIPLTAVTMLAHGGDWYVSDYLPPSAQLTSDWPSESQVSPHVDRIVAVLSWLDTVVVPDTASTIYGPDDDEAFVALITKINGWLEKPLAEGRVDPAKVTEALQIITDSRSTITRSLQHGDFVPWHMFELNGRVCLIDTEHAGTDRPRYYDLAYIYTRLYTHSDAQQSARNILKAFVEQSPVGRPQLEAALLPMLTLRALGMQLDTYNDRHITDKIAAANELLDMSLTQDLAAFL